MIARLASSGLRGAGLLGKALVVFFLARALPPEDLGTYGLIAASMGYALYVVGLDFYTYAGRSMLRTTHEKWPAMLRDQLALYGFAYLFVGPLVGLVFWWGLLPVQYIIVFYCLLILEHLSTECVRVLIISTRPLTAAALLFIRTGGWSYAFIALTAGGMVEASVNTALWFWTIADAIALLVGIWSLRGLPWSRLSPRINWSWIKKGAPVSALFFGSTLMVRGIFTFDRYLVQFFSGGEVLGAYVFYVGITGSLVAFLDAGVFSFRYPKLVSLYTKDDPSAFDEAYRSFAKQTLVACAALGVAAAVVILPLCRWTGHLVYLQHLPVYYVLLAASVISAIGYVPHYALYAMGQDRTIVAAHSGGFVAFIACGVVLGFLFGAIGVAFAILLGLSIIGGIKEWRVISLKRARLSVNR